MFTAYYAPMLAEGETDPSQEFPTEREAWQYVFANMCRRCQQSRQLYLYLNMKDFRPMEDFAEGTAEFSANEYPACSAEWFVLRTDDLVKCDDFGDILHATGYTKTLYKYKPEGGN